MADSPASSSSTTATPASSPAVPASLGERIGRYRVLLALAFLLFAADQATKLWIIHRLPFGTYGEATGAIPIIPGFCYFVHVGNTGAAWSMFSGKSVLLASLAAATLVAIFYWRKALGLHDRLTQVAFGLLCGGIVGNLADRLAHKHVIDFIDLHFGTYVYPTFNVADSGICIGVILYLWQSLRASKPSAGPAA